MQPYNKIDSADLVVFTIWYTQSADNNFIKYDYLK